MISIQKNTAQNTPPPPEDRFTHLKNYANELNESRLRENAIRRRAAWTPVRRLAQSQRAKAAMPWTRATGPRTRSGKDKAKTNALKHGHGAGRARRFASALAAHSCWLAVLRTLSRLSRPRRRGAGYILLHRLRLARQLDRLHTLSCRAGIDPRLPFAESFIDYLGDMASAEHDRIVGAKD